MSVKLISTHIASLVNNDEINALSAKAEGALSALHNKTGEGNDK